VSALSRRRLLQGVGAAGLVAGCTGPTPIAHTASTVDPRGHRQAGIARPAVAQSHCDLSVWDLPGGPPDLAPRIAELAAAGGRLTATVGLGPRLADVGELPAFTGDQLDHAGGDLMLQVCGDDRFAVSTAVAELGRAIGGMLKWRQSAFRGPSTVDGSSRNVLGFADGIVVPHGEIELDREVWRPDGSTIAVVRRMRLDLDGFAALSTEQQERVFGRRKDTAEPLSGGVEVDLGAKTSDGEYLIPADAHVRRANPLSAGTGLMLRRSYNHDEGLLFISFQRDLATFVKTMHRMVDGDALLRYATTTASASFLVPPGR